MLRRLVGFAFGAWAALMVGCVGSLAPSKVGSLRLIGLREIPTGTKFGETTFGGISGLVYDARTGDWIGPSDDGLNRGPSRAYRLRLTYDAATVAEPVIAGIMPLPALPNGERPDYEAVALDPVEGTFWFATEGSGRDGLPPRLMHTDAAGGLRPTHDLPAMLRFSQNPGRGPHHNETAEGLAFSAGGQRLWVALECPLKQDGDLNRLTALRRDGSIARQVAYRLAPVEGEAATREGRSGLSELLRVTDDRFLTLERTGWQGADKVWRFVVRLWEIDLRGATDVAAIDSLADAAAAGVNVQPVKKRLLVDFATFRDKPVYNLEGLAWGPRLPDGRAVLVVAADDNFDVKQATQFWVFAVEPSR